MNWRLADRFCDKYVAISKAVKDEMLQRGISEEKITVIYNAVNTDKFQFKNNKRDDNRLSNKDRSIVIGNVARFYPEKRTVCFSKSSRKVKTKNTPISVAYLQVRYIVTKIKLGKNKSVCN